MQDIKHLPKFKIGDVVVREDSNVHHVVVRTEWDEEDTTWYLAFSGEVEAEWDEQFYTLVKSAQKSSVEIEQLSVEELASLVEKAEKLLKQKQEECKKEIEDWIYSLTRSCEMDFEALECELFEKTQSVIDMLQRYLDKKGK